MIQIMFDPKSGCRAQRLYVSQITYECDGRCISDPHLSGTGAYDSCAIAKGVSSVLFE